MSFLSTLTTLATAAAEGEEKADILTSLGIDWKLLVVQLVALLLLVWLLGKYVYPVFLRIIDERQAKIDESTKAAEEAGKKAEEAEANVEKALKTARKEAAEIVATAKSEATQMTEAADKKAIERADRVG